MSSQTDDRKRRRKALAAWGTLAGVAALITTAAFTDQAFLNIGANGIGGSDSTYNLQVGATDEAGNFVAGWQEADDPAGVAVNLPGADGLFPGSEAVSVTVPVRNDSTVFDSSLAVSLATLADVPPVLGDDGAVVTPGRTTDADYLASLRFTVTQPATSLDGAAVSREDLTYGEVSGLELNSLAPGEESTVGLSVRLLSQTESGASFDDNSLAGKAAYLQAVLDGSSV